MIGSRTALRERLLLTMAALLLVVLAVLQYRWTGELSRAERERMQRTLENSASRLTAELERELSVLFFHFHPEPTHSRAELAEILEARWQRWQKQAVEPGMLESVLMVDIEPEPGLFRLDAESGELEATSWTEELEPLRGRMKTFAVENGDHWRSQGRRGRSSPGSGGRFQRGPGPSTPGPSSPGRASPLRTGVGRPPQQWLMVVPEIPAVMSPVIGQWDLQGIDSLTGRRWMEGMLALVLDRQWIVDVHLPRLAERFFGVDDYELAIWLDQAGSPSLLFRSPGSSEAKLEGDVEVVFFRQPLRDEIRGRMHRALGGNQPPPAGPGWRLVVTHRAGSLDRAVAANRGRNLATSALVLALLTGALVMLGVYSGRARRLAAQQAEFVTGITHELRTPIASISSLAENLADGIVDDPSRTRRYGELIRAQGRRLGGMVDRVLEVAGMSSGERGYHFVESDPERLVRAAIEECRPFAEERGAMLEITGESESSRLPSVMADERALRMAVVNLINNGIKYGGSEPRVTVSVRALAGLADAEGEVVIDVADSGWGIPVAEQKRIFEPFVRGRRSIESQVEGSGLGLALVERIVDAHGGRLEIESHEGRGSRFSLVLPCLRGA